MNHNNTIKYVSILIIVVAAVISGYLVVRSNTNQIPSSDQGSLAPLVDGKQVIAMTVYAANYSPNYFKVRVGVPVTWKITSSGQPGCDAGVIISSGLLDNPIYLNPNAGQVTVAEFIPKTTGEYTYSCSMRMVRGKILVVN